MLPEVAEQEKIKDVIQCGIQICSLQLYSEARGVQMEICPCKADHAESEILCSMHLINPLTPELNLSAQRCLTRSFTRDFPS
jgi:hypothetical protein